MIESRDYKQSDFESCVEIFESNVGPYFGENEIGDFEKFLQVDVSENGSISHTLAGSKYQVFYNTSDRCTIIACGGFGYLDNEVFLRWGLVNQNVHGQGVGSKLLIHRMEKIREVCGEIKVYIDTSQNVQGFYEKCGFKVVSVIKDGFVKGFDKIRMEFSDWNHDLLK